MKICHTSDTHGRFPILKGDFDIIIHSGDMMPDKPARGRAIGPNALWQRDWIRDNAENFKNWIKDKPFLFCPGNHDYAEPCGELKDLGINAIDIANKLVEINGYKIYGFPYVPYIGIFNWEAIPSQMESKVNDIVDIINENKIDILVAHAPPYKILDMNNQGMHVGNLQMLQAFANKIKHSPRYYLCGHVHSNSGIYSLPINSQRITISNAATDQRIIEI